LIPNTYVMKKLKQWSWYKARTRKYNNHK
jgi:hypothetical protein